MEDQDQRQQEIAQLMQRAEELGHDPQRVARAMARPAAPPVALQPVMQVEERSGLGSRLAQRLVHRA